MSESQPIAHGPRFTRRGLLKTVGAAGTAAVAPVALDGTGADPVGDADALPCGGICVGAAVVGGAAALGWALREYEVVGADDPPTGLTASALEQRIHETARTRQSTNASTFVDNKNILDGAKNVAYADAKIAAIEALNNQLTEQEVQDAATAAVDDYGTTIKSNFLKGWNESVAELESLFTALSSHADANGDMIEGYSADTTDAFPSHDLSGGGSLEFPTTAVNLPDGTDFTLTRISEGSLGGSRHAWDPINSDQTDMWIEIAENSDFDSMYYLRHVTWNDLWSKIESVVDDVRNGIITWVGEVYSQVQSGELDTADLLTPAELAELTSSEESTMNQALADLMALNIPVNLDREAEINLTQSNTTLYGSIGVTGEQTLNAGTTIDPSTDSHSYYFSYDVSDSHGTWDAYEEAVDGGVVTFTSEPHPSMTYALETGAQETATVKTSDFTDNGDGTWSVDISSQVETAITTVTSVQFYSESDETQMETVLLDEPFEIVTFADGEGTEHDSATYSAPSEPETDNNYITQEEWEQREQKYKEQIDKYEQAANSGGGGSISFGDFGPEGMVGGAVALVLTIVGIGQATK